MQRWSLTGGTRRDAGRGEWATEARLRSSSDCMPELTPPLLRFPSRHPLHQLSAQLRHGKSTPSGRKSSGIAEGRMP